MVKQSKFIILIEVIAVAIIGVMIMNIFDKRPFRFEDFKTADALKVFLESKYPIGSDGDIALKDLELAEAKCKVVSKNKYLPDDLKEYDYVGRCDYMTGWFAWPPKEHYVVRVLGDKNRIIIEFYISKYSGFMI